VWLLIAAARAPAADNLTLAPDLSFTDDSSGAFPIRGDHLADTPVVRGRATVVFFGASHCWNTAREAERLVALYPKFRDRVSFVVVDVNHPSEAQQALMDAHYKGFIPTVVVLAPDGTVVYARAGETAAQRGDAAALDALISKALTK